MARANSKAGKLELNWMIAPCLYYSSETQRCVPTRQDCAVLKSASAFHAPAAVMGSVSRARASILAEGDPAGTARSTILFVNADSRLQLLPKERG